VALALAGLVLILTIPFRTNHLLDHDSVQYALALHRFDVLTHQPHPPGSPFYIGLGRLAYKVAGDEARALVGIAIVGSVAAVVCLYVLGTLALGRTVGLLASLFLATQPIFWSYSVTANVYTVQALLALGVGLLCWLMLGGNRRLVPVSALFLGLAGGFRSDVTVFLAPLWVWSVWRVEPRRSRRLAALGLLAAAVAAWVIPLAWSAGGVGTWFNAWIANQLDTSSKESFLNAENIRSVVGNTLRVLFLAAVTAGPLLLLPLLFGRRRWLRQFRRRFSGDLALFSILWVMPSLGFLWLFDMTAAGHNLLYTVWLYPLAAAIAVHSIANQRVLLGGFLVLLCIQSSIFLFVPRRESGPLDLTSNELYLDFISAITAAADPNSSILVTENGRNDFRFAMFYLPDYRVLRLDRETGTWLDARNRTLARRTGPDIRLSSATRLIVWFVDNPPDGAGAPRRVESWQGAAPLVQTSIQPIDRPMVDHDGFRFHFDPER
jgi:4-amino-4-deoxy-L-arabinose transferase-like glycosyltransferase